MKILKIDVRQKRFNDKDYHSEPRIHVWPEGETILNNFNNRTVRPYTMYRKFAVPAALEALGLTADDCTVRWSKNAGCRMCPCSPGFVISVKPYVQMPHVDVHMSVTGDDARIAPGKVGRGFKCEDIRP